MIALSRDETWCTSTCPRLNFVNKFPGANVQVTDLVLRRFSDSNGHDIRRADVIVIFKNGRSIKLFAERGLLVADEPATKELLPCNRHAGNKPCVLYMNVVLRFPALQRGIDIMCMADVDFIGVKLHTDNLLRCMLVRLHAYKLTRRSGQFDLF